MRSKVFYMTGAALFTLAAPAAHAADQNGQATSSDQSKPPPDTASAEPSGDIIVTARRTNERLQETPVAVTALDSAALADKSAFNMADIGRQVPNLTISGGRGEQGQAFVFIRGIGQADDNPSVDPGVAIYVDDVYLGRTQGSLFNLGDIAQIEVLRGPQGTLYGKNTMGGAIKVTSRIPGPDPEYSVGLTYGNYNEARLFAAISHPLTDKLFARISGVMRRRDGVMENLFSNQNIGDINTLAGRLILRYAPDSRFDALLSVDASNDRSAGTGSRLTQLASPPTPLLNTITTRFGSLAPYVLQPGGDPYRGGRSTFGKMMC